ncbi:phosphoribulokinase [Methylobacterium frigidaeris]|uniref:Phosphoribulokinase n=1 Tax=Methylobacterium frigidaeris TaxID=2038277 RepID=A0AA37H840_9HYPH|nr:phosphoribulokinase [Methylobacterium frigidaeris]PIK68738.1 phosphoribulokinase [Methylobacterium frigidaeris]GJD61158.1 Phosphoribulokinase 1 [Methylobacterium frigidaeris]
MSALHPIVSVTGSSGSGTTSVRNTFEQIFRREGVAAVFIEGDAFHALDRAAMREAMVREPTLSHFGERANLLPELEAVFREYAASGRGRTRHYVHDAEDAARFQAEPGTFTPWEAFPEGSDLLFYEGLHGALANERVDIAGQADLRIGVVPVINLEWIQKLHRDKAARGYSTEAVTDVILRRMPDYVTTICPQFTNTDINFQRIPTVDTSNPFVARWIPTADESMVVIRFRDPKGIDFPYLISMIAGSFMSRANSVVIPGGKLDLAMQLILTPMILRLVERRRCLL